MDCSLPGSSAHGLFQARVLQWLAISFSRDLLNPEIETRSPALAGRFFRSAPPGKPLFCILCVLIGDERVFSLGNKVYVPQFFSRCCRKHEQCVCLSVCLPTEGKSQRLCPELSNNNREEYRIFFYFFHFYIF